MTKSRLMPFLKASLLILTCAAGVAACRSESVGTASDALTVVQGSAQTCEALGESAHACLGALQTCVTGASDAAAIDACKTSFAGCLPADPPGRGGPGGHGDGDHRGGHHGGHGEHAGHGGPHGGGDMAGGCPGMGQGDACNPSAPIVDACKKNLDACLAGGSSVQGCVATADECIGAAIQTRFKAFCSMASADVCDDSDAEAVACDQLDRACKDGVALPDPITARPSSPVQVR